MNKLLRNRLNYSLKSRQHEIDSLWQRTTYHSVIVGALFVARYNVKLDLPILIILDILLILVCFIWYLSGRGSKFWQEAWENEVGQVLYAIEKNDIVKIIRKADFETTKKEIINKLKDFKIEGIKTFISSLRSEDELKKIITNKYILKKESFENQKNNLINTLKTSDKSYWEFIDIKKIKKLYKSKIKNAAHKTELISILKQSKNFGVDSDLIQNNLSRKYKENFPATLKNNVGAWNVFEAYRFSPSKLNIIVSFIAFIAAYLQFGYDVFSKHENLSTFQSLFEKSNFSFEYDCWSIGLFIFPIIFCFAIIIALRKITLPKELQESLRVWLSNLFLLLLVGGFIYVVYNWTESKYENGRKGAESREIFERDCKREAHSNFMYVGDALSAFDQFNNK